ncbi:MAG: hypothetical protein QOI01_4956 [Mycobacterium sp.]|nr:hypothetical protein [Mycobacterium sp.]
MTTSLAGAVTTHRLDNGMALVAAPDPSATTVAMSITWRAGFVDDPDGAPGLAHLIEHLMFQGTRRHGRQDYYRAYFGSGGCTNAYTRTGHTTYHAEFPVQLLPTALELEADRFGDFAPTREAVEQERALIIREIAETTGARPLGGFPWEQLQAILFADSAHAHNGYVTPPGPFLVLPASCQEFVATRYRPEQATIALVGRFDPAEALALAAAGIGQLAYDTAPFRRPHPIPAPARRILVEVPSPARRHALAFGWRLPEPWLIPRRRAALVVLAAIVHGDSPSGLKHRLHDRDVRGVVRADFGMFGDLDELPEAVYLTVQAYHGPTQRETVHEAMQDTVETLARRPPPAEVRATAARLANQRRRVLADPLNRAQQLAEHHTLWSSARRPWTVLSELAATDADAVADVAGWLAGTDHAEAATRLAGADQ